jgi:agmatine/peptidylarginine deiminase
MEIKKRCRIRRKKARNYVNFYVSENQFFLILYNEPTNAQLFDKLLHCFFMF